MEHVFADVADLVSGKAHCFVHGKECSLPSADILISGPACTSVSGERSSTAEFATCYSTGKGASGVTYQCGFRDMVPKIGASLAFYENVKKVTGRNLAKRAGKWVGFQEKPKYVYKD